MYKEEGREEEREKEGRIQEKEEERKEEGRRKEESALSRHYAIVPEIVHFSSSTTPERNTHNLVSTGSRIAGRGTKTKKQKHRPPKSSTLAKV